jgi:hypothetical protein
LTLTELHEHEESLAQDLVNIDKEAAILEKKRKAKLAERAEIDKKKEQTFRGMSASAAYELGRDLQRAYADKRRKLE